MTGLFIQVRLDSSRLPGKALLPLAGMTVVEHAFRALAEVPADYHILLTDPLSAPKLTALARKWGFRTWIGSRDNVLTRFAGAIRHFHVDTFIRATGDNPLVDWQAAALALECFKAGEWDYFGFKNLPLGGGVEIVNAAALLEADANTHEPYDREHVTPYIYNNPEKFRVELREAPDGHRSSGRITMDTRADYEYILKAFKDLYRGDIIPFDQIIRWLSENER
ncbi:MAG: acylneuraminate cytidylyltransferase [Spirochaetales bacterium]|nr:acylneuraminate cytidylyltransferase [Spirochaetales bacterium]